MEQVAGPQGSIPTWIATPAGIGPWPSVVVIHDALGMTEDLRNQVAWLAGEGFVAAGPDLYKGRRSFRCVVATMRDVGRGRGAAFDDVEAVRTHLLARTDTTATVGVIGFCLGGGFALALTPTGRYDAASVNYGSLPGDADEVLTRACPVVASYGGRDPTLRNSGDRLARILDGAGIPNDVHTYPEAGHGFLNDHDDDDVPVPVRVLGWISRTAYDPEAAADARRRIVDFLHEHLGG